MLFIKLYQTEWWKLDMKTLNVFNFNGGFHSITEQTLASSELFECNGWHDVYLAKKWCPLEVNIKWPNVWISPEGLFYDGDAHENRAEELLEIVYGEVDVEWAGDRLEELGWVRATSNLMWEVRVKSDYWYDRNLTQKQYDALWDWCKLHNKKFPKQLKVN